MLKTLNLELNMPTCDEAMEELRFFLLYGEGKSGVIKIIHGYGSTGRGGKIRSRVRNELIMLKYKGEISAVIFGEEFTSLNKEAVKLSYECYELSELLNRYNRGVTVIKI